jgi:hypothetical protein
VLDSAGYGSLTITKAISISSDAALAGVSGPSGGTAITINAGAYDVVNLRGLDIEGAGSASVGIQFNTGQSLIIQRTRVSGFTNVGINFQPNVTTVSNILVSDSVVANNGTYGVLFEARRIHSGQRRAHTCDN